MPLAEAIDYGDVALFYNISGPTPWLKQGASWGMELPRQSPSQQQLTPLTFVQVQSWCPIAL